MGMRKKGYCERIDTRISVEKQSLRTAGKLFSLKNNFGKILNLKTRKTGREWSIVPQK